MGATVEEVSGKLITSKFPNRQCFGKKKVRACVIFFRASKICLLPALWACDLKKLLAKTVIAKLFSFGQMKYFQVQLS